MIVLVVTILVGGSMRRGPPLHYEKMRTATGFGLNVEEIKATPSKTIGGEQGEVSEEEEENVLDWSNSSMLAFVSLFYVSSSCPTRR